MITAVPRQYPGVTLCQTRVTEPLLVDHCRDGLATGEAELHDVGELPVGVLHGDMVGHHQALQGLGETLKFYEAA